MTAERARLSLDGLWDFSFDGAMASLEGRRQIRSPGIWQAQFPQLRNAAAKLHAMGAQNVVITGGHLGKAIDLLSFTNSRGVLEHELFKAERQRSNSTHGTGCAFSTAMACHLALGRGLPEAVLLAKAYVTAAIVNAQPLGRGTGPLHLLYRMHEAPRRAGAGDPDPVN